MESTFDGILITEFGTTIELQQSILNWLILCVIFTIFFIVAGKKFEKADVRKAPDGILLLTEMITGLCTNIIGDNLKEKTRRYLPFMGTLIMMMAVSNLLGLIGLQPPTSNLSFNVTLALRSYFMAKRIQYLTLPSWYLISLSLHIHLRKHQPSCKAKQFHIGSPGYQLRGGSSCSEALSSIVVPCTSSLELLI